MADRYDAQLMQRLDPSTVINLTDYDGPRPTIARIRDSVRGIWIKMVARQHPRASLRGSVRFPYYHHVFDDEREGFARHLRFFRQHGDIIPIDDAIDLLNAPDKIDGRYFSITFDDGFRNNYTNATPILIDSGVVAAFFLPSSRICEARHWNPDAPIDPSASIREPEYLTWDECRAMVSCGMTIGSHGVTHRRLSLLTTAGVQKELLESRLTLERETGSRCTHFACPWGRPGLDFSKDREPVLAARVGYSSFLTTARGRNNHIPSPYAVGRDQLMANWPTDQLRYFFFR